MLKTPQGSSRFKKHKQAINTGIVTAFVFLATYGFTLRQQSQFNELLNKSLLMSSFNLRVKYDRISFEDISQGMEICNRNDPQSCLLLVDYLFKAYNNADLYIDKLGEFSDSKNLSTLKPNFINQRSSVNNLMDDIFGISIKDMKKYSISTPREYINYFREMGKSIPTDGDSLRNSLTKFKANNLSLLAKTELIIGRESSDSKTIMESYYGLQYLFICTIAIELLVFILMNSVDIVINNE